MLEGIRRYQYSPVVKGVAAFLGLSLTFWGLGGGALLGRIHPVATVNGQQILGDQVEREATQLRQAVTQIYGANAPAVLKSINLRQEAMERLIEGQLVAEEARHLGIYIGDDALQQKIASTAAFQQGGQFDFQTYQDALRNSNLLPSEYENSERERMIADTVREMVTEGVQASDDEARQAYNLGNERIGLRYLEVPYADFIAKVSPTAEQVAGFYQKNSEQFREPERVKIVYVRYEPLVLAAKYEPTDKEISSYYGRNLKSEFAHPDQVHAHHILIEVANGATETEKAAAKAKAQDVLKQAQAGGDFAICRS
jgi:peptidyl-prolyl cis-trans isomerase D